MFKRLILSIFLLTAFFAFARGTYMEPLDYIKHAFNGQAPSTSTLWLTGDLKSNIKKVLGHEYRGLRIKYWKASDKTVWVLNEIGKEEPITVGITIQDQKIKDIKVLIYRESRGDEVRHPFFTKQFFDATLNEHWKLDRHIDGITGATLSVRALTKLSRMALLLDQKVADKSS